VASSKTYVVLFACPEGHPASPERRTPSETDASDDAAKKQLSATEKLFQTKRLCTNDDDDGNIFGVSHGAGSRGKKIGGQGGGETVDGELPQRLPWRLDSGGQSYAIAAVRSNDVLAITDAKISVEASALLSSVPEEPSGLGGLGGAPMTPGPAAAAAAARALADLEKVCGSAERSPQPLHPTRDLKIQDIATVELCHEHARLVASVPVLPSSVNAKLRTYRAILRARRTLRDRIESGEHALSDAHLQQMPDFQTRVEVLQSMGYLDADRTVTLKGRVACEIATGDELVGTEILFSGVLADASPETAAAVLSALVFQEKSATPPDLESYPDLRDACSAAYDLAVKAGEIQREKGLPIDPTEYACASLKFGLTEVVRAWAKGVAFVDACGLTDVQEGSIVRTVTRLDEMTRDVRNAARIMGDSALFEKMERASAMIKRDIVFSASLYVAGAK
jgi:antiviral helicase SKI2